MIGVSYPKNRRVNIRERELERAGAHAGVRSGLAGVPAPALLVDDDGRRRAEALDHDRELGIVRKVCVLVRDVRVGRAGQKADDLAAGDQRSVGETEQRDLERRRRGADVLHDEGGDPAILTLERLGRVRQVEGSNMPTSRSGWSPMRNEDRYRRMSPTS